MIGPQLQDLFFHLLGECGADLFGRDAKRNGEQQRKVFVTQNVIGAVAQRRDKFGGLFVGAFFQTQLVKQRMIGSIHAKNLAQHFDHVTAERDQALIDFLVAQECQKLGL